MKVSCDNCYEEFEIKQKSKDIGKDLRLHYFDCPNCNKRYENYYSNSITRELQSKLTREDIRAKSDLYKEYQKEFKEINK